MAVITRAQSSSHNTCNFNLCTSLSSSFIRVNIEICIY